MTDLIQSLLTSVGSLWDDELTNNADTGSFGQSTTFCIAQKSQISSMKLYLKKVGNPTGNIIFSISKQSAPSAYLVSVNINSATLTTDYVETELTFSYSGALYPMVPYTFALVPDVGATLDTSNYVVVQGTFAAYFVGSRKPSSSTWSTAMNDKMCFKLYGTLLNDGETVLGNPFADTTTGAKKTMNAAVSIDRVQPTSDASPHRSGVCQTFTTPAYPVQLRYASFMLSDQLSGVGSLCAKIYEVSGTVNVDSIATGSPLATSDAATPTVTGAYCTNFFHFSGANGITLAANHVYALTLEGQSGFDNTHGVTVMGGADSWAGGNLSRFYSSAWQPIGADSYYFGLIVAAIRSLTVTTSGAGSVTVDLTSGSYTAGTVLTANATPALHYLVNEWDVNAVNSGSGNSFTFTILVDTTLNANTALMPQYTLTITKLFSNESTVTPASGSLFYPDDNIVLTASPINALFYAWKISGVSHVNNPYTFNIASNTTVYAVFVKNALGVTSTATTFPKTLTQPTTGIITAHTNTFNSIVQCGICYNRAWYAEGLWWVIYNELDGDEGSRPNKVMYATSSDGVNWVNPQVLFATADNYIAPSIAFNGNRVYMIASHNGFTVGEILYYSIDFNTATLNSDGTLTLNYDTWQVINQQTSPNAVNHARIFLDKQSRPWITYTVYQGGICNFSTGIALSYVDHSINGSSTFTSAGGIFPYLLSQSSVGNNDMEGVAVPMVCLSDNTMIAATTANDVSRNGGFGNGAVFHFNSIAMLNSYDLGVSKWIYPFETNICVTKNDRVFFESAVLPFSNLANQSTDGSTLIELSASAVVNYTTISGDLYGFQIVYDPDFNRLYILGANTPSTDWVHNQTPDVSMWIYDLNANQLSQPYLFYSGVMALANNEEYLESANINSMGDGHKFLFTISSKKDEGGGNIQPDSFHSAVVSYFDLFGETATPYPSRLFKQVLENFKNLDTSKV